MNRILCAVLTFAIVGISNADTINVTVTGEVDFNQIGAPPLGNANPGDAVTLSFDVDSNVFTDSVNFPVRGYNIIESSFSLMVGAENLTIQSPFPAGQTPFFVIRNNDPGVDGFFIGTNIDGFPNGIPVSQAGIFEQFRMGYSTTYPGDRLPSLDVLDALGTYDFTGLSVFSMGITDGPFDAMGMIFAEMTITPEPTSALLLVGLALPLVRRR